MPDTGAYLDDELFNELFEMFKDQCFSQFPVISKNIDEITLEEGYKPRVDELFRSFHNFKASTAYLGLGNMNELVSKVENVLNSLRKLDAINDEGIVLWLQRVKEQFRVWVDEMEDGIILSEYDKELFEDIKVTQAIISSANRIKSLSCLYIDDNKKRAKVIVGALDKILSSVRYEENIEVLKNYINNDYPNIIIVSLDTNEIAPYEKFNKRFINAAFIFVLTKPSRRLLLNLGEKGITHILTSPIKGKELKRELLSVTHTTFTKRHILVTNKKIHDFILNLEPLPLTVIQIQGICDDEESSISDLINVVKQDSIIVGMILNAASNPMYGLKTGKDSIEKAIATFGKKTVKALCFGMMSSHLGKIDLSAYNITQERFLKVGSLRLNLMNEWYQRVDRSKLGTLCSSAILGNLGQILLSSELCDIDGKQQFLEISKVEGFNTAEEKMLHTNCSYVSSDILSFWHLPTEIVDSIRFSSNPADASADIHSLAIANYIVYQLVDLEATIAKEIPEKIVAILEKEGLQKEALIQALDKLQGFNTSKDT